MTLMVEPAWNVVTTPVGSSASKQNNNSSIPRCTAWLIETFGVHEYMLIFLNYELNTSSNWHF